MKPAILICLLLTSLRGEVLSQNAMLPDTLYSCYGGRSFRSLIELRLFSDSTFSYYSRLNHGVSTDSGIVIHQDTTSLVLNSFASLYTEPVYGIKWGKRYTIRTKRDSTLRFTNDTFDIVQREGGFSLYLFDKKELIEPHDSSFYYSYFTVGCYLEDPFVLDLKDSVPKDINPEIHELRSDINMYKELYFTTQGTNGDSLYQLVMTSEEFISLMYNLGVSKKMAIDDLLKKYSEQKALDFKGASEKELSNLLVSDSFLVELNQCRSSKVYTKYFETGVLRKGSNLSQKQKNALVVYLLHHDYMVSKGGYSGVVRAIKKK